MRAKGVHRRGISGAGGVGEGMVAREGAAEQAARERAATGMGKEMTRVEKDLMFGREFLEGLFAK